MKPALFRTIPTMWAAPAVQYTDPYPTLKTGWYNMQMMQSRREPEWLGYYNVNGPFEFAGHHQPTRKYKIS